MEIGLNNMKYKYALLIDYGETIEFKGMFSTYQKAREEGNSYKYPYFIMDVNEVSNNKGKIIDISVSD